ncbi:hypothetical protein BROC_00393 [Candidatus Brocadiaceae bacterium]|nr:hypothetical protein BROC_00393 [Candidatus Brocadiaceae bacterium]
MIEFFVREIIIEGRDFVYDRYRVVMLRKASVPLVLTSRIFQGIQTDAGGILLYFSCGLTLSGKIGIL